MKNHGVHRAIDTILMVENLSGSVKKEIRRKS